MPRNEVDLNAFGWGGLDFKVQIFFSEVSILRHVYVICFIMVEELMIAVIQKSDNNKANLFELWKPIFKVYYEAFERITVHLSKI